MIGQRLGPSTEGTLRTGVTSWPVSVGYFSDEEKKEGLGEELPTYQVSFTLYENGVTNDLVMDYGDYALSGRLQTIEPLEPEACPGPQSTGGSPLAHTPRGRRKGDPETEAVASELGAHGIDRRFRLRPPRAVHVEHVFGGRRLALPPDPKGRRRSAGSAFRRSRGEGGRAPPEKIRSARLVGACEAGIPRADAEIRRS